MPTEDTQPIKGMADLSAPAIWLWQDLEQKARDLFHRYGLTELRTPMLEREELFVRSLGDTTDVVQKEMFTLDYQGKMRLTLRPEGTAGVVRHLAGQGPEGANARVYYMGPMFRAERPQAGRRRQFHQTGAELTGEPNPLADVECIAMQAHLLEEWGLRDFRVHINTRGTAGDRPAIVAGLREALLPHLDTLCEDCRKRMDRNILRVLDCKRPACGEIASSLPPVTDLMSAETRAYFDSVQQQLADQEVKAAIQPRLVRGLDYYEHTVWEITHPGLGAQDALSGGGRYRITHGGRAMLGVGFAMGMERLIAALESEAEGPLNLAPRPQLWLVSLGETALRANLRLALKLRRMGISCGRDTACRSMKAQMRTAGKAGARFALIRGETEIERGISQLKDLDHATQEEIREDQLTAKLA